MNKELYITEVSETGALTAGSKAKEDIVNNLLKLGFNKIDIKIPNNKFIRYFFGRKIWKNALSKISPNSIIFYQYPAMSRIIGDSFINESKKISVTKVMIIHDIDSLRFYINNDKDIER